MRRPLTLVTVAVLSVALTLLVLGLNPLRRSEKHLEEYILGITPLGSSYSEVLTAIEQREWKLVSADQHTGFFHQGVQPNRVVGEKSIRASLGDYQSVPLETNVSVFWAFDSEARLTSVWVWKTQNGP